MPSRLFVRKCSQPIESHCFKKVLGPVELTLLGVGASIGTGIFVFTGTAAAGGVHHVGAGPAIIISFLITAVACGLAALCYAEFASMVPASGSAYTYAYASFGELAAWIIGWDLILEYAVGNIAVAIGWSEYFANLLAYFHIELPAWLSIDPISAANFLATGSEASEYQRELATEAFANAPRLGVPVLFNLPAVIVVFFVSMILIIGIRESARFNSILVLLKIALIGLFLFVGFHYVDFSTHWQSFAPNGWKGIMSGSALIFFAYIGFDAVSTTAEEARNPQRDLPIAMLASLVICTILYIAVATVLTGMVPLQILNSGKPVADALNHVGESTIATILSLGAVLSITSVLIVFQLGQTRIFFAMARDGLLPKILSQVSPRFGTPVFGTILTGMLVAIPAGLIDIGAAAELTNIGTLFAFFLVAAGVMVLRIVEPNRERRFRAPCVWLTCPACMGICLYLMISLPGMTWLRFFIWMVIGMIVYFSYGFHHSVLQKQLSQEVKLP